MTQQVREAFGEEPVVVLVEGDLQRLVLSAELFRLLRLEGCLSGNVPEGAKAIPGPCTELAELDPVEFVSGPATFAATRQPAPTERSAASIRDRHSQSSSRRIRS